MSSITRTERKRWALDNNGERVLDAEGSPIRVGAGSYYWLVTYRDNSARRQEVQKRFDKKADAQQFLNQVTADLVNNTYVRPGSGRVSLREYTESDWKKMQTHRESTRDQVERHLRLHIYPALGDKRLDAIQPSDAKRFIARLLEGYAASTVLVIYRYTAAIFNSAVQDRLLTASPFRDVPAPKVPPTRVRPPSTESLLKLVETVPPRFRALIILNAGTGLRPGESFGLTVDRLDLAKGFLEVDRQLTSATGGTPNFGPLKTATSYRTIPLAAVVREALEEHLSQWPPSDYGLVFTNTNGDPLQRSTCGEMLKKARSAAGIEGPTLHALRHYFASLLIQQGESVKAVQALLGHASAVETLDTYGHLWPGSDARVRDAVNAAFNHRADPAPPPKVASS